MIGVESLHTVLQSSWPRQIYPKQNYAAFDEIDSLPMNLHIDDLYFCRFFNKNQQNSSNAQDISSK